jgi:hypothetical protein
MPRSGQITCTIAGRSWLIELTDNGWLVAECEEEIDSIWTT